MSEQAPRSPELTPEQLTDQVWDKVHGLAKLAVANGYPSEENDEGDTVVHLGEYEEWPEVNLVISPEPEPDYPSAALTLLDSKEPEMLPEEDEDFDEEGNWIHADKGNAVVRYTQYAFFKVPPEVIADYDLVDPWGDWRHDKRVEQFWGEHRYNGDNEYYDDNQMYKDWIEIPAWKRHSEEASEWLITVEELLPASELVDKLTAKVQSQSSQG